MTTNDSLAATISADHLLLAVDIMGTFVFAVEGAMAAVNGNLDLIGVMTLAFSTAFAIGAIRRSYWRRRCWCFFCTTP